MNIPIRTVFPLLSVLALATAACQGPSPTAPTAPTSSAAVASAPTTVAATGKLQIDTRALFAQANGRRVLAVPPVGVIRVRVRMPETDTPVELTITGANPDVTISVPPGLNRLVEVEGLVQEGENFRLVKRVAAIATVAQDGTTAVAPNYGTTAAADTLGILFAKSKDTHLNEVLLGNLKAALAHFDFEPLLMDEVLDETEYHPGMNVYKQYNPVYFPTSDLADQVLEYLETNESMGGFEPGGLGQHSGGLEVHLGGIETGASPDPVEITILDPERQTETTTDGIVNFGGVAPGTWAVYATQGEQEAWSTVTVDPNQPSPLVELNFPGKEPLNKWIFRDETADEWGFFPSNGLEDLQLPFEAVYEGPVVQWFVQAEGAPHTLTMTGPSDLSVEAYRYLAFQARSSEPFAPFTVRLLNAANQELGSKLLATGSNDGPLRQYHIDLTDPDLITAEQHGQIAGVAIEFAPVDVSQTAFQLDNVRFTQAGPKVLIDETQ